MIRRPASRPVLTAALLVAVLTATAGVGLWSSRRGTAPPSADRVRVVAGDDRGAAPVPVSPAGPPPAAPPVDRTPSPARTQALQADAIRAFPMLYAVRIECDAGCTLVATLGPDATTGDWPRSQWPYDGNLERFLAARGYMPLGPLTVDQPGDSDTLLRVPVALPPDRG